MNREDIIDAEYIEYDEKGKTIRHVKPKKGQRGYSTMPDIQEIIERLNDPDFDPFTDPLSEIAAKIARDHGLPIDSNHVKIVANRVTNAMDSVDWNNEHDEQEEEKTVQRAKRGSKRAKKVSDLKGKEFGIAITLYCDAELTKDNELILLLDKNEDFLEEDFDSVLNNWKETRTESVEVYGLIGPEGKEKEIEIKPKNVKTITVEMVDFDEENDDDDDDEGDD